MKPLSGARQRPRDRVQTETDKTPTAKPVTFPAPRGGWVENQNVASGMPETARILENMFPTLQGIKVRSGCTKRATVGARCYSLFAYKTASIAKLFGATSTAVYDISALNPSTVPSAAFSSQTSGYYSTEQMGTVGGEYLYAVNGTDKARLFDGSTWTQIDGASTPAITGATTSTFSHVWKHRNRLWFVQKNTRVAWYLPVDSVGGAAADFSLAGIFQKGGSLLFGTTWSQDAGDGSDDRQVFVSTEGEIAVYAGGNPASATDWGLVGLYSIPKPRGQRCHIRAGGDVLIGTEQGVFSLSAIVAKDPAALDASAVSLSIEPSWRSEARKWDGQQPWEMLKWPRENMLMVSLPHTGKTVFPANLQSGKWTKYIGWDVQTMTLHNDVLYFADKSGFVFEAESGGTDNGASYVARVSYSPTNLGEGGTFKVASAMQAAFLSIGTVNAQLSVSQNYDVKFPALPTVSSIPLSAGALWDVGTWDVALWDDDGLGDYIVRPVYLTGWRSVGAQGLALAPQVQMVISGAGRPNIELIQVDMLLEGGGAVV
jgi:hypothetical protein